MPLYEYRCTKCGKSFEIRQSIGEDNRELRCPVCQTPNPERLISSFFSKVSDSADTSGFSCPTCSTGSCGLPGI